MEKIDNYERKKCESCGNEFGCGAKAEGCWCTQVELSEIAALSLRTGFKDCLCPACLKTKAENSPAPG